MKLMLSSTLIEDLSLQHKPITQDLQGDVIFKSALTPYIVYDSHSSAPVGFGVKVGAISKTYIIQRNIEGRVLKIRVGNVKDFETLNHARAMARQLVQKAIETKTNPNISRRKMTLTEQAVEEKLEALIETNTVKLRMRSEMAKLHNGTIVNLSEAALFLGISESTLKTLRFDGSGLKCIKYKSKTHNAQNLMVHFTLGELRRFIKESIE